jgi:hypothetical protein
MVRNRTVLAPGAVPLRSVPSGRAIRLRNFLRVLAMCEGQDGHVDVVVTTSGGACEAEELDRQVVVAQAAKGGQHHLGHCRSAQRTFR